MNPAVTEFHVKPVTLTEEQSDALRLLESMEDHSTDTPVAVIEGYAGTGKEQPVSATVQTPHGPRALGDIRVGDQVFGRDGRPTRVLGIYPQGVKPVYRVTFRDGSSTRCGLEHLWTVESRAWDKAKTIPLSEMLRVGIQYENGLNRYKIPLCEPVHYESPEPRFDPYVIGVLIGDGAISGSVCSFSTPDIDVDIARRVSERVERVGFRTTRYDGAACPRYTIKDSASPHSNRLLRHLREIGIAVLSTEKFLPLEYLQAPVESRLLLLAGLMDTDGTSRGNRISFSTSSARLADDVVTLVRSLGGTAIKRGYTRKDAGGVEYHVNVKTLFNPFLSERKAPGWKASVKNPPSRYITGVEEEGEEEQVCIKVNASDELYLTDDFIVTHNTTVVTHWLARLRETAPSLAIAVAAPTWKAVNVLSSKAPDAVAEFASIHSLMGLRVIEARDGTTSLKQEGRNRLAEFDICVVDEASMIDDAMFALILQGRSMCRIVFVGDPAQLPPVSSGRISPTFTEVPVKVVLRTVVRQAANNPIIRWSMLIRDAIQRGQRVTLDHLAADLRAGDDDHIQITGGGAPQVVSLALSAAGSGLDQRVLGYRNIDVENYNVACHYGIHANGDLFSPGEPVMSNEQFQIGSAKSGGTRLRNCEEMTVVAMGPASDPAAVALRLKRDDGSEVDVEVARDYRAWQTEINRLFGEYRRLRAAADQVQDTREAGRLRMEANEKSQAAFALRARLAPIRHSYALTAHKAQGSTFDAVIIDWASLNYVRDAMEFNRLLYVAITRPSKYLVVVA